MKGAWTRRRLERLYRRYSRIYWNGKLPRFNVLIAKPEKPFDWFGLCELRCRRILIDIDAHKTDQAVRKTLLHEMAHVAAGGKERIAHGYRFWGQLERLLRCGAPINVGLAEAPTHRVFAEVVPRRFPMARRAMEKLEAQRRRELNRELAELDITPHEVTDKEIVLDLAETQEGGAYTWRTMLWGRGPDYGLIDVGGRPTSRWADHILKRAYKAHRRARREFLLSEKLQLLNFEFTEEYRAREVKPEDFYAAYAEWCRQRGQRPLGRRIVERSM